MFENLRNAFREAVENFNKELSRDQVPETVDRLLKGMIDEVSDAKVAVRELEAQIARTEAEITREKGESSTARRRGKMAADIGDQETADVATQYAAKHEARVAVLDQKLAALRQELTLRTQEVEEMLVKVKEARAKRDALAATSGRTAARDSIGAADDLFAELDRMAEQIGDEDARARAAEDFGDMDLDGPDAFEEAPREPAMDVDQRLEELKRRMGRE